MALKLYMTPGSCSTGIHILLETLELPFEASIDTGWSAEPAR